MASQEKDGQEKRRQYEPEGLAASLNAIIPHSYVPGTPTEAETFLAALTDLWVQVETHTGLNGLISDADRRAGVQILSDVLQQQGGYWMGAVGSPAASPSEAQHAKTERSDSAQEAEINIDAKGLSGNVQELVLQLLARVTALKHDATGLVRMLENDLVPTIARLERDGRTTPEELVDVVFAPLNGLRFLSPARLIELVGALRGVLESQEPQARQKGYYTTRAGLAQWLTSAGAGDHLTLETVVFYYHEILSLGPTRLGDPELVRNVANNLAAALAEYWRDAPDPLQGEVLSRIQSLAIVGALRAQPGFESGEVAKVVEGILEATGLFQGKESSIELQSYARAIMQIANVPSSWRSVSRQIDGENGSPTATVAVSVHGEDWMTVMSVVAAVLRMAANGRNERDEIPSALFNAGVALLRVEREKGRSNLTAPLKRARLAVNSCGLAWALTYGDDWDEALVNLNGLDCAVNFFGAVADVGDDAVQKARRGLQRLAGGLFAVRARLDERTRDEFFRLERSLAQINIRTQPEELTAKELCATVDEINRAFDLAIPASASLDQAALRPEGSWIIACAAELCRILKQALGSQIYETHAASLGSLAHALSRLAADPEAAWALCYADMAEPEADRLDVAEGPREHSGPFVRLGTLTRAQWIEIAKKSVNRELASPVFSQGKREPLFAKWMVRFLEGCRLSSHG